MMAKRKHIIRLDKPARYWDDGFPLGNGRLGAMVMGKTDDETIFINEETLWYGPARDRKNSGAKKYLPEIRCLLQKGELQKAQFLAKMAMTSLPKYNNPFQPAGDLRITFLDHRYPASDYQRWLDLEEAEAYVTYNMNGIRYKREHFVSGRYQVFTMRLTSDSKNGLTFCVNMNRKPFEEHTGKLDENTVCNYGQCGKDGISYFTGVRLASRGGTIHAIGDFTYVSDAEEAYIYVACGTDYADKNYKESCLLRLDRAQEAGFEQLRREHRRDYLLLYGRMDVQLGNWNLPSITMDRILEETKKGEKQYFPFLVETLFHFARYLMISSTYNCLLPSNLQGIWNGDYVPPWQSQFTININTEMNYWIAEKCNLPECEKPLFSFVKRMVPNGQKTAEVLYGCRGACAHHTTNIWADTDPEGVFDTSPIWPMGLAWLTLFFFEHYAYTQDTKFLREEALPVARESIRFFKDYLFETDTGELITGPSLSPENSYYSRKGVKGALCMGPSMDSQILRQLFSSYLQACKILQIQDEDSRSAAEMLSKLPKIEISADGRIMEWREDYQEAEPGHRHISHLFALHPGHEITEEKKDLFVAARKTLETRLANGGGHTGWSCAWIACFFARLKDGEKVEETIWKFLKSSTKINLLDTHPPFQIDGNFGIAEAILESLAQSHSGYLEFLPALPQCISEGKVDGMILRGKILADFAWKDGKLTALRLKSFKNAKVKIRLTDTLQETELTANIQKKIL